MKALFACIPALLLLLGTANAQFPAGFGWVFPRESPPASVSQTLGVTEITIRYHRPIVKERVIWGCQTTDVVPKPGVRLPCLVPDGQVWRAGANEATTITFSTEVSIEGQPLPAGTYGLFMIPGNPEWTIVFSKRAKQWGSFSYNQGEDALRVKVAPTSDAHLERLGYEFPIVNNDAATVALRWEKKRVAFKVAADLAKQTSRKAMATFDPSSGYFAADYYYQNKINLEEALRWINATLAFGETAPNFMLKARILAELKRFEDAVEVAGKAAKTYREKNQIKPAEDVEKMISEWNRLKK